MLLYKHATPYKKIFRSGDEAAILFFSLKQAHQETPQTYYISGQVFQDHKQWT